LSINQKYGSDPVSDLSENELIKFTLVAFKVSKNTLPAYSCEKSKHKYTQPQLMSLTCLMRRLKLDYRVFTAVIELMPKLLKILGLKSVPHFTTLQKFFKRLGSHFLDKMLDFTVELFDIKDLWVAIDGTGHSSDQASLYYSGKIQKTNDKKWRKRLHQKPNSNRHINTSHNSSQSSKRT